MSGFFVFTFILWLLGSPLVGFMILLLFLYWLDRRFIGLFPSILKPWRRIRRLKKLMIELNVNPHDISTKQEIVRILIERKRYKEAKTYLEQIVKVMDDSSEIIYELGLCQLKLGELEAGEKHMQKAIDMNPRVRYGEPYLRLGEALAKVDTGRAVHYLEQFKQIHSSSCEAYFRLGQLYELLERSQDAKEAYREAINIYHALPKYKRKSERKWVILAGLKR